MKLLAVFAIGVIAMIGSPALSNSKRHIKPVYPFTDLDCADIADMVSAYYRGHKASSEDAGEPRKKGISDQIRKQLKSSTKNTRETGKKGMTDQIGEQLKLSNMFSDRSRTQLLTATQMATIYLAFCK